MGAQAATVFDVSGSAQTEHGVKRVRGWFGGAQFTLTLLQKCRDWRRRAEPRPMEHGGWNLRRGALPRRTASQPRGQVRDHLVGVEGFEPPTSNSQSSRSTNLSYTPRRRILTRDFAPATAFVLPPNSPAGTTTLFRKMPRAMPHGPSRAIKPPVHQPSTQAAFEIAAVQWGVILDLRRVSTRRTGPGTQVSICPLALHTKTHRMTSTRSPDLHLKLHLDLHLDLHLELRARVAPEKSR